MSESSSSTAWDKLAAWLVLLSLTLLLFAAALPSDQLLSFRDAGHLYLAIKTRTAEALQTGQLPTWEERMGCGWPFLADPVSQVFYPANLLFLFLSPVQGLKYFVLLHLAGAGWALMLLARDFGVSRSAALVGGLLFLGSGAVVSQHWSPPWIAGLPWLLISMAYTRRLLLGRGSWNSVALLAGSLALMILAGAFELVVPFVAYGIAEMILAFFDKASTPTDPPSHFGHRMLPRMGWGILAGGIAAGLAAWQLLPTFELFWLSSRSSGLPTSLSSIWSLHPGRLLELVAPHLFGNAAVEVPWTALLRPSFFANRPFLAGIYLGVPTLALALGGCRRLIPRQAMFLAAMLLSTLLLSLGDETPLFALIRELLPGVALFRYPAKIFTLTMIPIAILAAAGADGLLRGRKEIRRLVLMGALGLAILLLLCSLLGLAYRDGIVEWIGEGIARENLDLDQIEVWHQAMAAILRGLVTALIFLTVAVMMDRTLRPLKLSLLCLLIILDLGLANRSLVATTSTDAHLSRPPSLPAVEQFNEASGTVRIGHSLPGTGNLLYEPHLLLLQGYRVSDSYGSMQLASEAMFEIELREHPVRLLQLRSTRFALEPGQGAVPFQVRAVTDSLPRALVIPTATAALNDQFGARYLRSPDFDPRREVVLSDIPLEVLEWVDPSNRTPSPGAVLMTVDEPNEIRLEAQAEVASYLLLNDSWFPGWQATVNGRPVPIHRANLMFRAVQIPAGGSEVLFTYRPQSVRAGLQVSGLSLLLLGWLFWESYRTKKGQRPD